MTAQKLFHSLRDQISLKPIPTRLQGYDQTIPSHPQPASAQATNSVTTSQPVQIPGLDERDWQNWHQPVPTPATAEQLERLQAWLRPLPTALIQLRQLLQTQQTMIEHLNAVSSKLMEIYQQELTQPLTSRATERKTTTHLSWSMIASKSIAPLLTLILTVGLLYLGLQPMNQKIDHLINRLSPLEKLLGGRDGR